MPLSGVLKITSRFHGHLKTSLKSLSGVIKLTLPIENTRNPRSAVQVRRRNAPSQILQQFELSRPNR